MANAHRFAASAAICALLAGSAAAARAPHATPVGQNQPQSEQPQAVAGATNFVRLDANFASGGVTSADAFAAIRKLGFRTVVNLRTAAEQGADIEGEARIVEQAGLKYVSLPFAVNQPDTTAIDKFLDLARDANSQPVYVHCFSGQRANAFWMIKRVLVDGWTPEKASAEADTLKITNQRLREIAAGYVKDHAK